MRQPFPLRLIQHLERHLPAFAPVDPAVLRRRRGWAVYAGTLPSLAIAGTQLGIHRADVAAMWPAWRPMAVQFLLVMAGAALVAAVAAGMVAWRKEAFRHA